MRFDNITQGINTFLTPLFERYGVRPTYLLSPEVMEHAPSVAALRAIPHAQLGTHLHAEYCDPQRVYANPAGTESLIFPSSLSDELLAGKLRTITEQFTTAFGHAPRVYRAARYGADPRTWDVLAQLGYTVDTSVTPGSTGVPKAARIFLLFPLSLCAWPMAYWNCRSPSPRPAESFSAVALVRLALAATQHHDRRGYASPDR